ncbi:helix-turn-helix domain-containing protein [Streptacidiphilus sp. P02-A3a]|uniref:helix-turn-helix domain-containing protein n=1 Tax=Streptacidiphilus sp. P02-A3a TaxID=2704468 RepID=UPI0015FA0543|nr:helix-turn-helix domain-containing protein [Streptacidiphilus sp. P02-A3a]QMU67406.1 hypothetical protein GXP74_03425 [Streptacidiphilus sp. P02-A3a]
MVGDDAGRRAPAEQRVMPIRDGGKPLPKSGPKRVALAAMLASEYEARASITELMARGGCDYDELMKMLKEAGVKRRESAAGHQRAR